MVGMNIPKDQLNSIVKRTMKEADCDKDGFISLDEFKKVLLYNHLNYLMIVIIIIIKALDDIEVAERMSVCFSRT